MRRERILIASIAQIILPEKLYKTIAQKANKTKQIMASTMALKIFWGIIFFLPSLALSLIIAIPKTIIVWSLKSATVYNLTYSVGKTCENIALKKEFRSIKMLFVQICFFAKFVVGAREKRKSFGKLNPDITFFVIRPYFLSAPNPIANAEPHLFALYYRTIQLIAYAVENNLVPIVDWKNYGRVAFEEDHPVNGTENCWEYFFKQPSMYTLDEVYNSKNVILSHRDWVSDNDGTYVPTAQATAPFEKYLEAYASRCHKYLQYTQFNTYTLEYITSWEEKLLPKNEKILGVALRATSYGSKAITGHPIQPSFDELVEYIRESLIKNKIEYLFFVCEAEGPVIAIKESFGDKAIVLPRLRHVEAPTPEYNVMYEPGNRYQSNLDYLTEIYLLSRCTALCATMTAGIRTAAIWNSGAYKHMNVINKGKYK